MPTPNGSFYYQECLIKDFNEKRERNSRYSMRAHATKLACDPSALCRIFSGKQPLSVRLAKSIVKKLSLNPDETRRFLRSVAERQKEVTTQKLAKGINQPSLGPLAQKLSPETFMKISDLDAMTVLESHSIEECSSGGAEAITEHTGVPADRVEELLALLSETGLLEQRGARRVKTAAQFRADPSLAPKANVRHQEKLLSRAEHALHTNDPERQLMNGLSMAIDPKRIPKAKKMVSEFVDILCDFLEQGERTEVYQLGIQLFPVKSNRPIQ
jgi:uncharacterized protein (TIGR02147 family)